MHVIKICTFTASRSLLNSPSAPHSSPPFFPKGQSHNISRIWANEFLCLQFLLDYMQEKDRC